MSVGQSSWVFRITQVLFLTGRLEIGLLEWGVISCFDFFRSLVSLASQAHKRVVSFTYLCVHQFRRLVFQNPMYQLLLTLKLIRHWLRTKRVSNATPPLHWLCIHLLSHLCYLVKNHADYNLVFEPPIIRYACNSVRILEIRLPYDCTTLCLLRAKSVQMI